MERQRLLKQVFDTARSAGLGDIYVLAGRLPLDLAADLASGLRILPRAVYLVPDEQISNLLQYPRGGLGNLMTLETQKAPLTRPQRAIKRSLDMLIAIVAFLFLTPLLVGNSAGNQDQLAWPFVLPAMAARLSWAAISDLQVPYHDRARGR